MLALRLPHRDSGSRAHLSHASQVAVYLLTHGLKDFDAVIFLDEADRKMALLRDGMKASPLRSLGLM